MQHHRPLLTTGGGQDLVEEGCQHFSRIAAAALAGQTDVEQPGGAPVELGDEFTQGGVVHAASSTVGGA